MDKLITQEIEELIATGEELAADASVSGAIKVPPKKCV